MRPRHKPRAALPIPAHTRASSESAGVGARVASLLLPQHVSNTTDRVKQLTIEGFIYFVTQPGHVNVNDIVEWGGPRRFPPYVAGQHLARNNLLLVPKKIFEQLELSGSEFHVLAASSDPSYHQIHFQVGELQPGN